ncbi:MAG: hypothetical protein NUW37_15375 [Planctomycetes bacterium]|nr:hypothetical protein [Planctomycetota bacterium]
MKKPKTGLESAGERDDAIIEALGLELSEAVASQRSIGVTSVIFALVGGLWAALTLLALTDLEFVLGVRARVFGLSACLVITALLAMMAYLRTRSNPKDVKALASALEQRHPEFSGSLLLAVDAVEGDIVPRSSLDSAYSRLSNLGAKKYRVLDISLTTLLILSCAATLCAAFLVLGTDKTALLFLRSVCRDDLVFADGSKIVISEESAIARENEDLAIEAEFEMEFLETPAAELSIQGESTFVSLSRNSAKKRVYAGSFPASLFESKSPATLRVFVGSASSLPREIEYAGPMRVGEPFVVYRDVVTGSRVRLELPTRETIPLGSDVALSVPVIDRAEELRIVRMHQPEISSGDFRDRDIPDRVATASFIIETETSFHFEVLGERGRRYVSPQYLLAVQRNENAKVLATIDGRKFQPVEIVRAGESHEVGISVEDDYPVPGISLAIVAGAQETIFELAGNDGEFGARFDIGEDGRLRFAPGDDEVGGFVEGELIRIFADVAEPGRASARFPVGWILVEPADEVPEVGASEEERGAEPQAQDDARKPPEGEMEEGEEDVLFATDHGLGGETPLPDAQDSPEGVGERADENSDRESEQNTTANSSGTEGDAPEGTREDDANVQETPNGPLRTSSNSPDSAAERSPENASLRESTEGAEGSSRSESGTEGEAQSVGAAGGDASAGDASGETGDGGQTTSLDATGEGETESVGENDASDQTLSNSGESQATTADPASNSEEAAAPDIAGADDPLSNSEGSRFGTAPGAREPSASDASGGFERTDVPDLSGRLMRIEDSALRGSELSDEDLGLLGLDRERLETLRRGREELAREGADAGGGQGEPGRGNPDYADIEVQRAILERIESLRTANSVEGIPRLRRPTTTEVPEELSGPIREFLESIARE